MIRRAAHAGRRPARAPAAVVAPPSHRLRRRPRRPAGRGRHARPRLSPGLLRRGRRLHRRRGVLHHLRVAGVRAAAQRAPAHGRDRRRRLLAAAPPAVAARHGRGHRRHPRRRHLRPARPPGRAADRGRRRARLPPQLAARARPEVLLRGRRRAFGPRAPVVALDRGAVLPGLPAAGRVRAGPAHPGPGCADRARPGGRVDAAARGAVRAGVRPVARSTSAPTPASPACCSASPWACSGRRTACAPTPAGASRRCSTRSLFWGRPWWPGTCWRSTSTARWRSGAGSPPCSSARWRCSPSPSTRRRRSRRGCCRHGPCGGSASGPTASTCTTGPSSCSCPTRRASSPSTRSPSSCRWP